MKYSESQKILSEIDLASKIIINCHRNPDPDSVGSALAIKTFVESRGKEAKIISPNAVPKYLHFLDGANEIEEVDFEKYDFSEFDLFILLDTSGWGRVYSSDDHAKPTINTINIDNHKTNEKFANINLLDFKMSSVCEMLYQLFVDWEFEIGKAVATYLLTGMIGDTGSFQFEVFKNTFSVANALLDLGVDIKDINYNLFNTTPIQLVKFWGEVIDRLEVDDSGFAWSAIPYDVYKDYRHLDGTRETAATLIIRKIENTKFGFILTEDEPGSITISFRARDDIDIATLASKLGGGGHPAAAGAHIQETGFDEALERVLNEARNHAQKTD